MSGTPKIVNHCHCSRCRKVRGTAHATNLVVALDGLRYLRGMELLTTYKAPDAQYFSHTFCRVCGASMPRLDETRGIAIVPMGSFDDDPGARPVRHIFRGLACTLGRNTRPIAANSRRAPAAVTYRNRHFGARDRNRRGAAWPRQTFPLRKRNRDVFSLSIGPTGNHSRGYRVTLRHTERTCVFYNETTFPRGASLYLDCRLLPRRTHS